jgi:hypothetical protein
MPHPPNYSRDGIRNPPRWKPCANLLRTFKV